MGGIVCRRAMGFFIREVAFLGIKKKMIKKRIKPLDEGEDMPYTRLRLVGTLMRTLFETVKKRKAGSGLGNIFKTICLAKMTR